MSIGAPMALRDIACHAAGMDTTELGALIRAKRKAARLSQADLAEALDMAPRTIYAWEHGQNAGAWDHLEALERILGTRLHTSDEDSVSLDAAIARLRSADLSIAQASEILRRLVLLRDAE